MLFTFCRFYLQGLDGKIEEAHESQNFFFFRLKTNTCICRCMHTFVQAIFLNGSQSYSITAECFTGFTFYFVFLLFMHFYILHFKHARQFKCQCDKTLSTIISGNFLYSLFFSFSPIYAYISFVVSKQASKQAAGSRQQADNANNRGCNCIYIRSHCSYYDYQCHYRFYHYYYTSTTVTAAVTLLPFALCVALPSHCLPVQVQHCVAFTFLFRLNSNHTCVVAVIIVAVILVIIVVVAVRLNHIIMLARLLCFG